MAVAMDLCDLPDDIEATYIPYRTILRQRQQGKTFSTGSYTEGLKLFRVVSGEIEVKAAAVQAGMFSVTYLFCNIFKRRSTQF